MFIGDEDLGCKQAKERQGSYGHGRLLFQMAAQTGELAPMTNRARLHIQPGFLIAMRIQKTRYMTRRFQLRALRMTERATIRRIDLVVAHQAIRHLRHVGLTYRIRFLKPPMTTHARIARIQQRPNLSPIPPKIRALIDSPSDHRRNVSQLQMFSVTEFLERRSLRKQARGGRLQEAGGSKQDAPRSVRERFLHPAACRLRFFACRPQPAPAPYPRYLIRQIFFPPSSETRMLPSGNCMIPTGRPHTSRDSGEIIQPVRNSRTGPLGLPPSNGMKPTS
jgi:hypothetical protein